MKTLLLIAVSLLLVACGKPSSTEAVRVPPATGNIVGVWVDGRLTHKNTFTSDGKWIHEPANGQPTTQGTYQFGSNTLVLNGQIPYPVEFVNDKEFQTLGATYSRIR